MSFALSTLDAVRIALARSTRVEASAYRMPPALEHDLASAAHRGAGVDVVLAAQAPGHFDDGLAAENAATAERLRAAGARVRLQPDVHLKAVIVDGVAWLDDRNFAKTGPSNVICDEDPADVDRVRAAIAGTPALPGAGLATDKASALALEVAAIATPSADGVALATESFGYGVVSRALRTAVASGEHVRLIVDRREAASPREASALAEMAKIGVEIRTAGAVDKVALTNSAAWLGSANATFAGANLGAESDWGAVTGDAATVAAVRARYDRAWDAARPLARLVTNC